MEEKDTLLNRTIDWLQSVFPANRRVVALGGLITAVSAILSAWLAAHFPGLSLGTAEIAGVLGAAALITMRLLDRWIDQWQHGENIATKADLEVAFGELEDSPDTHHLLAALGGLEGLGHALGELRTKVDAKSMTSEEISADLGHVLDAIGGFIHEHQPEGDPAINHDAPVPPITG